ncbi:LysR family transcriptional regulator [Ciceribacter sp. L1K23]|uniref:LysR family transcriptional regulator n=1 Tax=Ciceribacter sp. L1K23 TaxID=2820276 RepID=UPI001B8423F4|nr:LysR family transcriptional regulator [Ciceribacter sp. L1K23]MBR0554953.1 LysR family transcriptional regulator [Ciceribacter sp. L1K23]
MIPVLDWSHYRTFLAVLTHGSLSAAARELGLTQPTVGRHIDALERASGSPLFLRSQQGLLPTVTAREMLPHAEAMAASAAALARTASGDTQTPRGTVRISSSEVMGIEVLPPILADLLEQYPDLNAELSVSDAVEDLLRQEADIAVRMVAPAQEALISRRIGAIPLGFFAHRSYVVRHGLPRTADELRAHRLIGFDRQMAYVRSVLKANPELGELRFAVRTDSNVAQLSMIEAGAGIGICQVGLAIKDPELVPILPGMLDLHLDTYVVMHESLRTAPRCRVTFDALVEGLLLYMKTRPE